MAILSTAGGSSVTLDESSALQNAFTSNLIGDLNDNDIAASMLTAGAVAFSTRLNALGAGVPMDVALSGYDGSNTGTNAFSITPSSSGVITDIRFTDASGVALNGLDSALSTADGTRIYLYTDTADNNILLGRAATVGGLADPSGAIVFAAYIEETTSVSGAGGKIWTTLYQPLQHGDSSNPDDALNLLNKVFIGTTQEAAFSLANAPSGQNLFLMFTTANPTVVDGRVTGVSIIATGKDPANQSGANAQSAADDINITTGDTINTSQAGGPTTFGTNNQMITEQEGIRFTFVTGAKSDFTIANLDQNEADLEKNIDFTAVFGARTATFDIVQLQSGKSAQVKVSAFSTAAEVGTQFIDGYANDSAVGITQVRVIQSATGKVLENSDGSVNDPSINISFSAGVATITGVQAGYKIEYTTATDHNRVLVENGAALKASGNDHADFDIGAFKLLQVSTDAAEIGSKIIFEDDGPSIAVNVAAAADALVVDETTLATNASADFADNFGNTSSYGADGTGTIDSTYALSVQSAGADTGLVDVASGSGVFLYLESGQVLGRVGAGATANPAGAIAFTLSVSSTGTVTLDQQLALQHPDATSPDDAVSLSGAELIRLTRTDNITDRDGDQSTASNFIDIATALHFHDDGPSITVGVVAAADALTVDETTLTTDASANFADNFSNTPSYGADGAGMFSSAYALSVQSTGVDSGLVDVAFGSGVFLYLESGQVVGRVGSNATTADPAGAIAFTVSVSAIGTVTLDQQLALQHPDANNPDDAVSLSAAELIRLTRTDTITDRDGDQSTGSNFINIATALHFHDDGPSITVGVVAAPDALTADETTLANDASANFADNFGNTPSYGADGAGTIHIAYALSVQSAGVDSGLVDVASGSGVFLYLEAGQVVGRVGSNATTADPAGAIAFTLSVSAAGTVTLDQQLALQHPDASNPDDAVSLSSADLIRLTRTDTITDRDGDQSTASNFIDIATALRFHDDGPSIAVSVVAAADALTVDESAFATDASADFADNFGNAPSYGTDGAGTFSSAYALSVQSAGVDSGLIDVASGSGVFLYQEAGQVAGRVGSNATTADPAGAIAFTLSVSAAGTVTLDQQLALQHPDTSNPDDAVSLNSADLIRLTRTDTITDRDGDQSNGSNYIDIATALRFHDDGPSIAVSVVAPADALTVDETTLATDASANFSDNFSSTPSYGADGAGTFSSAYALSVQSAGVDSGLVDVASGSGVFLYLEAGQVIGRVGSNATTADPSGAIAFTLSVSAAGTVTLDQQLALQHPDASNPDDAVSLSAADLIRLTRTDTITDRDGDQSSGANYIDIATALQFKDDGSSIAVSVVAAADTLTVDETALANSASATASTSSSANFADNFGNTPSYGADGAGTVNSTYALSVQSAGVDSGLVDVTSGNGVFLYLESGQVLGRVGSSTTTADPAGAIAFTVSVSAMGTVTLEQLQALQHPDTSNPDDAVSLSAAELIRLTRTDTITDRDGDQSSGANFIDIATALQFKDDGASISASGQEPSLTVDETELAVNATANFAANFSSSFGADGPGTRSYTLGVAAGASGLVDTATGQAVNLVQNGSVVEGRTASGNALVFTVSVAGNGDVTLDQLRAVVHADTGNPDDTTGLAADHLVMLTATEVDKDGDSVSATLDIGQNLFFEDDGPAILQKSDLVYANASNPQPGGTGVFGYASGADARQSFSASNSDFAAITLSGTVGSTAISNATVSWASETASTAVFDLGFSYQADPASTSTTAATGTLTFDKLAGTYTVALAQHIAGFTTLTTGTALGFTGYTAGTSTVDQTQPDVSVAQLSSDFFVQFTGVSEPGGGTGADNLQALAPSDALGSANGASYVNGELFKQAPTWVSVSNSANGVAGDTIQKGEVLDLDFFNSNPTGFTSLTPTTQASGIFLKFDGIGSEDLVLVLKLVDPDDQSRTTKAIIIDNSDILKFGATIPAGYHIALDNNDGAVIIESNDFNTGSQNYLIEGAQLLVSTEGVSGTAINLNSATGAAGASTTTQDFGAATVDGDVLKISDIGFVTAYSGTLNTQLRFDVAVLDADGDASSSQALEVGIVGGSALRPSAGADTFSFSDADADGLLAGVMVNVSSGFASGVDKLDFATAGSAGNYAENLLAANSVGDFITVADAALNGTVQYYFGVVGSDGYLATDSDGDGITSIVKLAGVADMAFADIT